MSLSARDWEILAILEASLSRSDPGLTARFARFNTVAAVATRRSAARPVMRPAMTARSARWWHRSTAVALITLLLMLTGILLVALIPHGPG